MGMSGIGPIPFQSIAAYADFYQLSRDDAHFLLYVIREIDRFQLSEAAEKQAASSPTK